MSSQSVSTEASHPIPTSSYTLNTIDPSLRPTEEVACMNCPLAVWMLEGNQTVKCYCRVLYMFTWINHTPGKIKICDAPELARQAAEAREA